MADTGSESKGLSWKLRVKAWWEGYDISGLKQDAAPPSAPPSTKPAAGAASADDAGGAADKKKSASRYWSATRIQIVERLWGRGFKTPGADDHIPMLIKPFGLREEFSVADVGAGLGGATRMMAKSSGCWVSGLEPDPVLVKAAMERSIQEELDKQAPIHTFDPEAPVFDKRYDVFFSKEFFFTVEHKQDLFEAIKRAMKPGGQILFTDYVLTDQATDNPAVAAWLESEAPPAYPWTPTQYVETMESLGFDVRITEDLSAVHRGMIVAAWDSMAGWIKPKGKAEEDTQEAIIREGEIWQNRVKAIESGGLAVYRFFALAPSG